MIGRAIRAAAALLWLVAAMMFGAGVAKADGILTAAEQENGDDYGLIYCEVLDSYPSTAGVAAVIGSIRDDGFTFDNAVDVLGYTVGTYCDRHAELWAAAVGHDGWVY